MCQIGAFQEITGTIWNSTKDSVTTGMFVTRRPHGAKPQVKRAQGPAGRPNPMAGRPHFESVQADLVATFTHRFTRVSYALESVETGRSGRPAMWMAT
jgi:hypothetical protein